MASFSAPYNSLLPSPPQSPFFQSEISAPPSLVKFRQPRFSAAAAAATYTEFETETPTTSFSSRCASPPPKLASVTPTTSFYDLLGIPIGASIDEIKAAYRRLARACHPDVAGNNQESSATEFMKIHTAYSTLLDPEKRADYDRRLFRRRRSVKIHSDVCGSTAPAEMSRFTGYTRRRNWETDQCW